MLILLAQLGLILALCFVLGRVARGLGQSAVIGELVAGILLGPTLLGSQFPLLFPADSMRALQGLAQTGIVLYMFSVGLSIDRAALASQRGPMTSIAVAGLVLPVILAAPIAWLLFERGGYFAPRLSAPAAIAIMGAALAITALPMMARLLRDLDLHDSTEGKLALGAGALADIATWVAVGLFLAFWRVDSQALLLTLAGTLALILFLLSRWPQRLAGENFSLQRVLPLLALVAACAEGIGIHAVLGAFLLGLVLSGGTGSQRVYDELAPVNNSLMLPVYFAYSGFNADLRAINIGDDFGPAVAIIVAAFLGKGLACFLAARANGLSRHAAATIGILMNTRGLMELVLLNLCRELGLITPRLFSLLLLMTVVTTLMAAPALRWLGMRETRGLKAA